MRKGFIFLGVLLLIAAAGMFAYRQLVPFAEQAAYRDSGPSAGEASRGVRPSPYSRPEDRRRERGERRDGGARGLRMAELLINVLNIVVGVVGIWLAVMGSRMQRQTQSQSQSMTMGEGRK